MARYSVDSFFLPPSKDQLDLIRREVNEDEGKLEHVEGLLHDWINCQPHFPKKYDKRVVRTFLRNSKYNLDRAKTKLESHFAVRTLYPELFTGRIVSAEDIAQAMKSITMVFLPKLSEMGTRISIYKLHDMDPSNFEPIPVCKLILMMCDLSFTCDQPVAGDITVFDGAGITATHFIKFLTIIKMVTPILRQAYNIRLREIHIINAPQMVDAILSAIRPVLHKKVRNTFVCHGSSKSLCDYFGEEILPSNYGGKSKSLSELRKDWREILKSSEGWFHEQESVTITGAIPKKYDNLYFKELGVEGSFRTLQID